MKIQIGEKYTGPNLDRPALRKMPDGWLLEEDDKEGTIFEQWLYAAIGLLGSWIFAVIIFALI